MSLLQGAWTALHFACRNGHTETVKYLLTTGPNLSATDKVHKLQDTKHDFCCKIMG